MRANKHWIFWVAALGLIGALQAPRVLAASSGCPASSCVPITVNANLNYTKLHPLVTSLSMSCVIEQKVPFAMVEGLGPQIPVINRGFVGTVSTEIPMPRAIFADAANRRLVVRCRINLQIANGSGWMVQNTVTTPLLPDGSNYLFLDSHSDAYWEGEVDIPDLSAP